MIDRTRASILRLRESAKAALRSGLGQLGLEVRRKSHLDPLGFLRDLGIATVLDVGANRGQFASEVRRALPVAVIHSFEPIAGPFALLNDMAARDPLLFAHPIGLADFHGELEMNANEFSTASSLLELSDVAKEAFPYATRSRKERVHITTLDGWAASTQLAEPIFVKLDVQGSEDRVIRGGRGTMARARAVLTEVAFLPVYEGQPLFDDIHAELKALGFACGGVMAGTYDPRSGRVLYGDALFLRNGH